MPLGIVSSEEFEKELNEIPSVKEGEIIIPPSPGRQKGTLEVPELIRSIVSEDAIQNGNKSTLEEGLAKFLGISPSSVSAYKNGVTSTKNYNDIKDKSLNENNKKVKNVIALKARRVMKGALNNITDEKLSEAKPIELATIARHMSGIIKEMEPEEKKNSVNNQVQMVIYAPRMQFNENKYETIQLNE